MKLLPGIPALLALALGNNLGLAATGTAVSSPTIAEGGDPFRFQK